MARHTESEDAAKAARIAAQSEPKSDPDPLSNEPTYIAHTSRAICVSDDKAAADITTHSFATANELSEHLKDQSRRRRGRMLCILEGLPVDYVQVLGSHFDIDPVIFDSHAMRTSGQLDDLKMTKTVFTKQIQTFALSYPELFVEAVSSGRINKSNNDFMPQAIVLDVPQASDGLVINRTLKVKLCHATVISFLTDDGAEALLLLLDSPLSQAGARTRLPTQVSLLEKALKNLPEDERIWDPSWQNSPKLNIAEQIVEALKPQRDQVHISLRNRITFERLCDTLTDLFLHQWRQTVEETVANKSASKSISSKLPHQICDLIDSNLYMHNTHKPQNTRSEGIQQKNQRKEWERLLDKTRRYTNLLTEVNSPDKIRTIIEGQFPDGTETLNANFDGNAYDDDESSEPLVHTRGGDIDMETKQSINRITYLGGILLPFSIIASIFSMGDNYSPGGKHFFVFWVIAIPVCLLTTTMIYADSIRRMTVEQFAYQYGAYAKVEEGKDELAASSIADSEEVVTLRLRIWNRLASLMRWEFATLETMSDSSIGTSGNLNDTTSTDRLSLPPSLSIEDGRLVRRRTQGRSWRWRFWKTRTMPQMVDDLEDIPPPPEPAELRRGELAQKLRKVASAPDAQGLFSDKGSGDRPEKEIPTPPPTAPLPMNARPNPFQRHPPARPAPPPMNARPNPFQRPPPTSPSPEPDPTLGSLPNIDRPHTQHSWPVQTPIHLPGGFSDRDSHRSASRPSSDVSFLDHAGMPLPPSPEEIEFVQDEEIELRKRHLLESATRKIEEEEESRKRQIEEHAEDEHPPFQEEPEKRQYELVEREKKQKTEMERVLKAKYRAAEEEAALAEKVAEEAKGPGGNFGPQLALMSPPGMQYYPDPLGWSPSTEAHEKRKSAEEKEQAHASTPRNKLEPIKFKDAVGRKFAFPFHLVNTWAGMEELIKSAVLHVESIGSQVQMGRYDLMAMGPGPEGEIILPQVWEEVIEPGWAIKMLMWPMSDPQAHRPFPPAGPSPSGRDAGAPPQPPQPPGQWHSSHIRPAQASLAGRHKGPRPQPAPHSLLPSRPPPPPPPPPGWQPQPMPGPHRRLTGISEKHRTSHGGRLASIENPDAELGWARALGTIVGLKPK